MVDLIPGTALPITTPRMAAQPEGRGGVDLQPGRAPVSLLEKIGSRDDVSTAELAYVAAAIRSFDSMEHEHREVYDVASGLTGSTTGNCAIMFFEVPQGAEAWLTNVLVDVPGSATINPAAPYANAASFQFVAKADPSTAPQGTVGPSAAQVASLRLGEVGFAPTSAGGPILPGNWQWGDKSGPVGFGGEAFWYVLNGGSIAAVAGLTLRIRFRLRLVFHDKAV